MSRHLIVDLESNGLLPDIHTIWQICAVDDATGELFSFNEYDSQCSGTIADGIRLLQGADRLVFHHGLGYDLPAIMKVHGVQLDWRKVVDTLVLSRLGNPERPGGHSLAAWGRVLGLDKVDHTDWSQWSPAMEKRCAVDVEITWALYRRLKPMLEVMPDAVRIEHACAHETFKMLKRGFGLDVPYTKQLTSELLAEQEVCLKDLQGIFPPILVAKDPACPEKTLKSINRNHPMKGLLDPGSPYCPVVVQQFNPSSTQQVGQRLKTKYNWKPTKFTPGGQPEISEEVLRNLEYPEAAPFADFLERAGRISKLNGKPKGRSGGGWLHHVTPTVGAPRVHANLTPLRAVTGRPACSSPAIHSVEKVAMMRSAWVPNKLGKLVGVDARGIELRCLGHYLYPYDDGAYARAAVEGIEEDGTDVHSLTRDLVGLYSRGRAKNLMYATIYGAGDRKLGLMVGLDAMEAGKPIQYDVLGLASSRRRPGPSAVGKAVRQALEEGITGFGTLTDSVKSKARSAGKLVGLDGRSLWIRSPHSALNFLFQSAGIILIKEAMSLAPVYLAEADLVEDVDYGLVMWIHDEFQYEARPPVTEPVGQALVRCIEDAGTPFGFRVPLGAKALVGDNWSQTH